MSYQNSLSLPLKTTKQIEKIIRSKPLENLMLIHKIENELKKKRGYVFQMPTPRTPVICFMSGGLDSIVVTSILVEEFGLVVYPIYFDRQLIHSAYDRKSVVYFSNYFQKRYSKLFYTPIILSLQLPPPQISKYLLPNSGYIYLNKNINQRRGIPFLPAIYSIFAIHYAIFLKEQKGINIHTIFSSSLPSSSDWYSYESLSAYRITNLEICVSLNDYKWQFSSLPMEKEIGLFLEKKDLIIWGSRHNLPIHLTRTCNQAGAFNCGECDVCGNRREGYKKAGIIDNTIYRPKNYFWRKTGRIINKIIRIFIKT